MARNKKVEILSHDGQVLHPITDGDCVIFPDGETLTHKLSEQEEVMHTPEVVNSSPMFKVGEGDSSDYSANVLDGAYQEAVLKGQTYVNTIQEPSADVITLPTPFTEYERTQSKTFTEMQDGTFGLNLVGQSYVNCIQEPSKPSYVALGENLEFQNKKVEYTTDGQIKSAMLNGMTLVNLLSNKYLYCNLLTSEEVEMDSSVNTYDADNGRVKRIDLKQNLQANKKYLVVLNITQLESGRGISGFSTKATSDEQIYDMPTFYGNGLKCMTYIPINDVKCVSFYLDQDTTNPTIAKIKQPMIIEYQEGMENWDIPYFQGMQSVTMSTELENVCSRHNSSGAKNGKTFTVGTINDRILGLSGTNDITNYGFKQNTKYLMQFKISNLNLDGLSSIELIFSNSNVASGNSLFGNNTNLNISKNGIYRTVLTTSSIVNTSSFVIKGNASQWENTTSTARKLTISQIMCIEYQNGMENWDLPYFEITQLMKPVKVQTTSKNLCGNSVKLGQYRYDGTNLFSPNIYNDSETQICANESPIRIKPNTSYTLSKDYSDTFRPRITFFSRKGEMVLTVAPNASNTSFTSPSDAYYFVFNSNTNTPIDVALNGKYQLEESSTETPYTPHQEKTTSALEPITLRAIGNVKDTLDLSTGEYVQRICEIEFDGSESWNLVPNNYQPTNTNYISFDYTDSTIKKGTYLLCDKIATRSWEIGSVAFDSFSIGTHSTNNVLRLCIEKAKLTTNDVAGLKAYLASNPIKVQYQLANPITRKISLEYPNLQTYQDITHVQSIAMDGTLIPNIYLPSDIAYKTLLKPNTKYNLQLKQNVVNADNPLRVNVGGAEVAITQPRTLITTPSTLTSETVSFTGKGNDIGEVMLIENSTLLNGDIPYFEGIGDVHLGRVIENLCMANHTTVGGATSTGTLYSDKITSKITKTGSHVHIFQLTKNLENSKRYFIYCPYDYQYIIYGFRHEYNNSLSYTYQSCEGINKKYAIIKIDGNQQKNPYTHLAVGCHGNIPVDTTMTIRRPIICEYVDGMENWDWESIGYFTGARNIGNEFMRIGNKNLFDKNTIKTNSALVWATGGEFSESNSFITDYIKVKQGEYIITGASLVESRLQIFGYDNNKKSSYGFDQNGLETALGYSTGVMTNVITVSKSSYIRIGIRNINGALQDINSIQLEEASSATSYVAHKHNALYLPKDESIALSFEQGGIFYNKGETWANATNNTNTARIRTQLFDLEPNETYRVSCGNSNYNFAVYSYDNSLVGTSDTSWLSGEYYINTTKDIHKIGIAIKRTDGTNITPSALHQVRLEKVTDIHLRSVGNVKDELNLTRGVYIQRIGEIVLDGSGNCGEVYTLNPSDLEATNTTRWRVQCPSMPIKNTTSEYDYSDGICDKLIHKRNYEHTEDYEAFFVSNNANQIYFRTNKNKLSTLDVNGLKQYLSNNPITVQYQLATPIEHKIHIPMKNESNQTITKPNGIFTLPLMHSGNNHVDINSQIYPKVQSRDYISYPVIARVAGYDKVYTVFHNNVGSNLTVDLCGASTTTSDVKNTITTPSTISQYELRLSGATNKVSNVCVFNGDCMNVDVPYVQGVMNAVNPIVKNVGKNLFDGELIKGYLGINGAYSTHEEAVLSVNYVKVKPNTIYSIKAIEHQVEFYVKEYNDLHSNYTNQILTQNNIFKTSPCTKYIRFNSKAGVTLSTTDIIQLEEATPSQYEPYKENICQPDYGEIKLTEDIMALGTINDSTVGTYYESTLTNSNIRIRTKVPIKVKPNTTYARKLPSDYTGWVVTYDSEMRYTGKTFWDETFTTPINVHYIIPVFRKVSNANMSLSEWDKLHIFELSDVIHLRSLPNGVYDELNLETGEYIQRVGEIVFDGSQNKNNFGTANYENDNIIQFYYEDKTVTKDYEGASIKINCDKLSTYRPNSLITSNPEKIGISSRRGDSQGLVFSLLKTEISSFDKDIINEYFAQNPVVVQYQLATPIVKHVDIHNYPHSYKDGHVIISSNDPTTSIPAQLTYKCVTNRSGQIQEHTEQVEKQERQINELETLVLENIRMNQNRSQNFLTSLISTLEIEEE